MADRDLIEQCAQAARMPISVNLLHDCGGGFHRAQLELREVSLESRHLRLEGIRCDGTPIAVYANRNGSTLVVWTEWADTPGQPARYQRIMLDGDGKQWISHNNGEWGPLTTQPLESPAQPGYDTDLFGGAA